MSARIDWGSIGDKLGWPGSEEEAKKVGSRKAKLSTDKPKARVETPKPTEPEIDKQLMERFDSIVKENFQFIPPGCNFKAEIPGLESFSVLPPPGPDAKSTSVVLFWKEDGKEKHETVTLRKDGKLMMPSRISEKFPREALLREIVDRMEDVGLNFWTVIDQDILPRGFWRVFDKSEGKRREEPALDREDIERIVFLRSMPEVGFGFVNKREGGFEGYRGFVFRPGFVVLDNPQVGNAAYFVDETPPLPAGPISREGREAYLGEDWSEWLSKTKLEHVHAGATRVLHAGEQENWKQRL